MLCLSSRHRFSFTKGFTAVCCAQSTPLQKDFQLDKPNQLFRRAATDLAEAIDLKDACVHIEWVGASGKGKVEAFVLEFGGKIAGKGVLNKGMKATDVTLIIADPRHVGKYQAWAKGRN